MGKKTIKMTTEVQLAMVRKICCERITAEEMTRIIELIVDYRDRKVEVDRDEFRKLLGLAPLAKKTPKPKAENVSDDDADVIIIPATNQEFVGGKKFVVDIRSDAEVKILSLNEHFRENYLGKIEKPIRELRLRYRDVVNALTDSALVAELGGEDEAEVTLTEMIFLMKKQGSGKSGVLLIDGRMNTIFVRDIHGELGRVSFFWRKDLGWVVVAFDLDNMHPLGRVFYRD